MQVKRVLDGCPHWGALRKQMNVIDEKDLEKLWDKIEKEYCFRPSCTEESCNWIELPKSCKKYQLKEIWSKEQEKLVNSFFEELVVDNLIALDWQHDGFVFSPKEYDKIDFEYYDKIGDCNVYFPTYYPNGDYFFFINKTFEIGLFGHPWLHEILVLGNKLIQKFESNMNSLKLHEIQE